MAPWLWRYDGPPEGAYGLAYRLRTEGAAGVVLRGNKMQTDASLFDEFAAALQFPYYFGENWPALNECLGDLEWLPARSYALVIVRGDLVLKREPPERLKLLIDLLSGVSETWADPVTGDFPDRSPLPFHTVVQGGASELTGWGVDLPDLSE